MFDLSNAIHDILYELAESISRGPIQNPISGSSKIAYI